MSRRRGSSPRDLDGHVVPFVTKKGETVFRIDYIDQHGRRRRPIVSDSENEAWIILADTLRERDEILEGRAVKTDASIDELLGGYLDSLALRWKPSHVSNTSRMLPKVLGRLGVTRVRQISISMLNRYMKERSDEGRANSTINREVSAVRAMLNWGVKNEVIGRNPIVALEKLPEGAAYMTRPRRAMTDDEVTRFVAAAGEIDAERADFCAAKKTIRGGTKGRRYERRARRRYFPQMPLWRTMLLTGGRLGELVTLNWADVDLAARLIIFRDKNTKSGKARRVPMADEVIEDLHSLRDLHVRFRGREPQPEERVFLPPEGRGEQDNANASKRYHEILARAKIEKKIDGRSMTIHSLRHTFCTMLARAGVPLLDAQKLMGHSDPKLTAEIYAHVTAEDLRPSIAKLPRLDGADRVEETPPVYGEHVLFPGWCDLFSRLPVVVLVA